MKWQKIHPELEKVDFAPEDRYVKFGEKHGIVIIDHTLVWGSQTPRWVQLAHPRAHQLSAAL